MSIAFICTDASLEGGNNTPQEWATALFENGYRRLAVIDLDSASALIQMKKFAKSKGLEVFCGATLTVNHIKRDTTLWFDKNIEKIKPILLTIGSFNEDPEWVFSAISKLRLCFRLMKNKTEPDEDDEEKTLPFFLEDTLRIIKTLNTVQIKEIQSSLKCIPDHLPHGQLVCIAQTTEQYKKLLKLTSQRAINKHHNIHNPFNLPRPIAVDFSDIAAAQEEGMIVVDPCHEKSFIGQLLTADATRNIESLVSRNEISILKIGVRGEGFNLFSKKILRLNLEMIPFPTFRYTNKAEYEEFQVKVALHLKSHDISEESGGANEKVTIFDEGFPSPDASTCLINEATWKARLMTSLDDEVVNKIEFDYWVDKESTKVPLGEIHLPNYDMPVRNVVLYALRNSPLVEMVPHDESDARRFFSDHLAETNPNEQNIHDLTQKKLNDACMLMFAEAGLENRLSKHENLRDETRIKYKERLLMEYAVIEKMGFSGYFLIVYDVVNHARKIGVPVGDGRGSAAGSLIVYCLEITDVDPIEYDLQFERFLNPERVSMPDIDVDFGDGIGVNRNSVLQYVSEKYQQKGTEHPSSSQIANINKYQLKMAIKSTRSALGLSMTYDEYLRNIITSVHVSLGLKATETLTWEQFLDNETVKGKLKKEPIFAKVIRFAHNASGKRSTFGVHAGGVVISRSVITDYSAIECDDSGKFFTQFDKDDIEQAGLIKLDFLGLRTLAIIEEAVRIIKERRNITIEHRQLEKDEPDVMALIKQQRLCDIFQLESGGMRDLVGRLQPQDIGEIGVLSALYRPGAINSGMVDDFVDAKFGRIPPNYEHPALKKVTESTFGSIVYQEQVMSIVRELAGYSLGEADLLRRAMGKKKIEEMQKQKSIYNYRAQQYWREHYINKGDTQNLSFKLDVNLNDCKTELTQLGFSDILNEEGYLEKWESVTPFLKNLLDWSDADEAIFTQRINDMNYVVRLFKDHYHLQFMVKAKEKLSAITPNRSEEIATRLYFCLSQMVRFNQIFNKVEKFAGYGFNKSHAIAYSIITYKSAYLKTRYPAEFYSAALTYKDVKMLHDTVNEAKAAFNIQLSTPHINLSEENFYPESDRSIRYGLSKLRDMGKFAPIIVKERKQNGNYTCLYDFINRLTVLGKKPGSKVMLALCCTGALDVFIPSAIKNGKINGRQYLYWLRDLLSQSPFIGKDEGESFLHQQLSLLSDYELAVYYLAHSKPAFLKKVGFSEHLIKAFPRRTKKNTYSNELLNEVNQMEQLGSSEVILLTAKKECKSGFEQMYLSLLNTMKSEKDYLVSFWGELLASTCGTPIVETLNEELRYAGMYITSNPIRVLKVAELAMREPPGTYLDGYPVPILEIDSSFSGRRVSTYGIVRNVAIKTIKKEDSRLYGEKLLTFKIEDGANSISCTIIGTKNTKVFEKIITEQAVVLIGGEAKHNEYGLGIGIEAVKRYYPVKDDMLHVVSRK